MTEHRVLHVLPHRGGGGEEYVGLLEAMDGFRFERLYLTRKMSPLGAVASLPTVARQARLCDLMHIHGDAASVVCLPVLSRCPVVLTTHGLHLLRRSSGVRGALARRGMRAAVARAATTICNSATERDELAAVVGAAGELSLIPNAVEIPAALVSNEIRKSVRSALGLRPSDIAVLWAASLEPHKDPLTFVRAVGMAGPPVIGVMAGEGSMRAEVEAHGDDRLRVVGHRGDLDRVIPACDAFAMTSEREGVSLAILEAMAHRLPVVVSDRPSNPEAVGDDGLLVPFGDAGALAAALRRLADSHELRRDLGGRGRRRVERLYDARRMVDTTRRVYEQALTRRN